MNVSKPHIAIIGAGISGLTCAQKLKASDAFKISVFEKSRGAGGRMSTRRSPPYQFDHGFQYSTRPLLNSTNEQLHLAAWGEYFVPTPSANTLCKQIGESLDLHFEAEIDLIKAKGHQWSLSQKDQDHGPFDALIFTAPPVQTYNLLPLDISFKKEILKANMAPCIALMVGFERNLQCPWNFLRPKSSSVAWISQDSTKPGRDASRSTFVVHSTPEWATAKLDQDLSVTEHQLFQEFLNITGFTKEDAQFVKVHRWRYALTSTAIGKTHLWDDSKNIGACGDWLLGNSIHDAIRSAEQLAQTIIHKYTESPSLGK